MELQKHRTPEDIRDHIALAFTKLLRFFADTFFSGRYGHRAVILETVAAVPGMVGGALQHLKSLRTMQPDHGWIKILLDEAENERMHLLTFIQIAQPNWFERLSYKRQLPPTTAKPNCYILWLSKQFLV
jgi:ubiquinol oxidase